jgi:thioredoxin reductase
MIRPADSAGRGLGNLGGVVDVARRARLRNQAEGYKECDIVVIGGGPAGIAAATWGARYRRSVVMIDRGQPRNRWAVRSHGYFGADPIDPRELLARAGRDLCQYPSVEVCSGAAVVGVTTDAGDAFRIAIDDGSARTARRLILATGVQDEFPAIEGFFDHYGTSVFHCPTCDGFETQGSHVVVLGWSAHVVGFALGLLDWAASVTVVTSGHRFEGDDRHRQALERNGVSLVEGVAARFRGTPGELDAVILGDGTALDCQRAFFSIAHTSHDELARSLGCALTPEGCVSVDDDCQTSVVGVYAAGDLTPGIQLVQVAAAKGAVAGISAAQSLRGEWGAADSPIPAPDPATEVR